MSKVKKAPRRPEKKSRRQPVTRERAVAEALRLADAEGLDELTMRRLADVLGVEAMSLYHHVPNKSVILDGMVDLVFAEVELPRVGAAWKTALRERMSSLRAALIRHPWALRVLESRATPGPTTLEHHDAVLGCLRASGFSVRLAAHAYSVLDSFVFGFVHTELTLPFRSAEEAHAVAEQIVAQLPPGAFPHLVELAREQILASGYTYGSEFPFGLDLILDALERALGAERGSAG